MAMALAGGLIWLAFQSKDALASWLAAVVAWSGVDTLASWVMALFG